MCESKITVHQSETLSELIRQLPDEVAGAINDQIAESRQQGLVVAVTGQSPRVQFKLMESLFHTVHIVDSPAVTESTLSRLPENTVACYYAVDKETLLEGNQTDVTVWAITLEDTIDDEVISVMRQITRPVIPVLVLAQETLTLLHSDAREADVLALKHQVGAVREQLSAFPELGVVSVSDPESLAWVGDRVLARLTSARKVFGGLTFAYACLGDEAVREAEKAYIDTLRHVMLPYYTTLSAEEKAAIDTVLDNHLKEEDMMDKMVSVASNAMNSARTGIDSLFKTIKEKL